MSQPSKFVFKQNVSYGVGKKHTHYLKGHAVPAELLKEMVDKGLAVELGDEKAQPKEPPKVSVKPETPKQDG